jgi:ElaB/YqjD/DUF883 family membrane-anchored ribosome-binding protein
MPNIETRMQKGDGQMEKFNEAREAITNAAHETTRAISQAAHKARESAQSIAEKTWHDAKERTEEWNEKITEYVRKNPFPALGIAALGGAIFSMLLRRRR